jgi:hypothetical protein
MTPVDPTTRTVRSVDVPLGAGQQTLRCTLALDEHGEPEALILAAGFMTETGDGPSFLRPSWHDAPLRLPASALPALRDALEALDR